MFVHGDNSARQEKRGIVTKKIALGRTLRVQAGFIAGRPRTSTAAPLHMLFNMLGKAGRGPSPRPGLE